MVLFDADTGHSTTHPYFSAERVNPESLSWSFDRQSVLFQVVGGIVVYSLASDTFQKYSLNGEHWWTGRIPQGVLSTRLDTGSLSGVTYPVLIPVHDDGTLNIPFEYEIAHIPTRAPLAWTQDGRWLAVQSLEEDGAEDIYIVDMDSGESVNLTQDKDDHYAPRWSPDGEKLAWIMSQGQRSSIIIYDRKTENTQKIALDFRPWSIEQIQKDMILLLSPEQEQGNSRIKFQHASISTGEVKDLLQVSHIWGSDVSPDGTKIVYIESDISVPLLQVCRFNVMSLEKQCYHDLPRPITNTVPAWANQVMRPCVPRFNAAF